ncbi:MAG: hypothetical protein JRH20_08545 [Deltaproteobacteria bacterium]|nr:hypothetical protein [Deltaproteobacteria bacterium]
MKSSALIACALFLLACPGAGTTPAPHVTLKEAPPPTTRKAAVGSRCSTADECESGRCEGEGCAPGRGRCTDNKRLCTSDLRSYCGCDGVTFRASGSCPGKRYHQRGPCQP